VREVGGVVRKLAALVVAVVLGTVPASAIAAGGGGSALPGSTSPFSPGVPISPVTPTVSTSQPTIAQTTTSSSGSGGLSGSGAIAIAVGAILVLGGIAYFIWYDARRHAPVRRGAAGADLADSAGGRARGSKAAPKPRKLSPAERRRRKRGRARR
jgi:hypothetical protein